MVRVNRKPPLTFAALEPVLGGSRVVASLQRFVTAMTRAADGARVVRLAAKSARLWQQQPERRVTNVGWVIVIAALTHIAILLFIERYHFPNRAALVMPIAAALAAMAAIPLSGPIARALIDRRRS